MKRKALSLVLCFGLLTGCAPVPRPTPAAETPSGAAPEPTATLPSLARDEEPTWLACRIVDGAEEGELLLAELDHSLRDHTDSRHDGKGVYRLSLNGTRCREEAGPDGSSLAVMMANGGVAVYLDGERAQPSDLRDGMNVEISFNGTVLETFPAQLGEAWALHAYSVGTSQSPGGSCYDLCGLYLQVLDDLWNTDPNLNFGITTVGLDLSQAPGELLESEKAALTHRFGELHGVEAVQGTMEELIDQGYITVTPDDPMADGIPGPYWQDGCLFTVSESNTHGGEGYSLPVLFFNAQKWSSPRGAYFFKDCSAVWPEGGTWSGYKVGGECIS